MGWPRLVTHVLGPLHGEEGCGGCEGCWVTDPAADTSQRPVTALSRLWANSAAGRFAGEESGQGGGSPGGVFGRVSSGEVSSVCRLLGATIWKPQEMAYKGEKIFARVWGCRTFRVDNCQARRVRKSPPEGRFYLATTMALHTVLCACNVCFPKHI